jgi:5-methylcytosine-specific restriction endonuclease McrA
MTWENRGLYRKGEYDVGWDVDHIVPTSSANTEEELIKLFHYTNLRPLCSKINRDEKKNKI